MIAHSYISDSAPDTIFDDIEGFAKDLMKNRRAPRGSRKSIKCRSFGGISNASSGNKHGGGRLSRCRQGGNRNVGSRQKPRAKRQRTTKSRGKKPSSKV